MRMKENIKKTYDILLYEGKNILKKASMRLPAFLLILSPFFLVMFFIKEIALTNEVCFKIAWYYLMIALVAFILECYNQVSAGNELEQENKIPVAKRRFTKAEGKKITVNQSDIYEIVTYLYDLENYMENKGAYQQEEKKEIEEQ